MEEIFDEEEETNFFAAVLFPFLIAGFKKGVDQGTKQGGGKAKPEDIFTLMVQNALSGKSLSHATQAIGTTKDELQALLDKAVQEGQSIQELGKAIDHQFKVDSRVRSLRIARTELTDVINDGTTQTLEKEGYEQKEWSTVIDGRERETHAAADGQVVGINDSFNIGGAIARYPGDESLPVGERVNCRCAVLAAGLPQDRRRQLGESFLRTHGMLERNFVIHLRRAFERQRRRILSHFPS